MGRILYILVVLLMLLYGCENSTTNNSTREEVLKKGAQLYTTHGCHVCHSLDGSVEYGPPLNAIYMKELKVIRNGKEHTLKADRRYLLRAINEPGYEKDISYRNKEMPITSMPEEEAELLVEYLIALDSIPSKL